MQIEYGGDKSNNSATSIGSIQGDSCGILYCRHLGKVGGIVQLLGGIVG